MRHAVFLFAAAKKASARLGLCAGLLVASGAASCLRAETISPQPSAGCAADVPAPAGAALAVSVTVDGTRRAFLLDVPPAYDGRQPLPVVVNFHGFGGGAAQARRDFHLAELAQREGFVAVHPDGLADVALLGRIDRGWRMEAPERNREVQFFDGLLADLKRRYCIDDRRVYVTGMSNGAFLSHILGCARAHVIAAIAPVAGGRVVIDCHPARPLPVLIHGGTHDRLIAISEARDAEATWIAADGCATASDVDGCTVHTDCREGAVVTMCAGEWAHTWPQGASERIWRFFQAHPRP